MLFSTVAASDCIAVATCTTACCGVLISRTLHQMQHQDLCAHYAEYMHYMLGLRCVTYYRHYILLPLLFFLQSACRVDRMLLCCAGSMYTTCAPLYLRAHSLRAYVCTLTNHSSCYKLLSRIHYS
jgi:hypothetical protein